MATLKLIAVGTSTGIVLPDEPLTRMLVEKGAGMLESAPSGTTKP